MIHQEKTNRKPPTDVREQSAAKTVQNARSTSMRDFLNALGNVIVDRTADELIGAVVVALGLGSHSRASTSFRGARLPQNSDADDRDHDRGKSGLHGLRRGVSRLPGRKAPGAPASERNQAASLRLEPMLVE